MFGGPDDKGMGPLEGLALYEPWEACLRPDIFLPEDPDNPLQPTWQRLRIDYPYMAFRYDHTVSRRLLQTTPWEIRNPKTDKFVMAFLVDWGPHDRTGRLVDLSPFIMKCLDLKTDDLVVVTDIL